MYHSVWPLDTGTVSTKKVVIYGSKDNVSYLLDLVSLYSASECAATVRKPFELSAIPANQSKIVLLHVAATTGKKGKSGR
jgi:hypothetical protein